MACGTPLGLDPTGQLTSSLWARGLPGTTTYIAALGLITYLIWLSIFFPCPTELHPTYASFTQEFFHVLFVFLVSNAFYHTTQYFIPQIGVGMFCPWKKRVIRLTTCCACLFVSLQDFPSWQGKVTWRELKFLRHHVADEDVLVHRLRNAHCLPDVPPKHRVSNLIPVPPTGMLQ